MTSAVLFLGPSLPTSSIKKESFYSNILCLDSVDDYGKEKRLLADKKHPIIYLLPPVSEGDILRTLSFPPNIIGIVDGFFENIPAVWHKEILYAMKEGVHVYGAASMGALRAVELETFGMVGIGAIFNAFKLCMLEDDDEVAVIHGPKTLDYLSLSEAMVNIRRTVDEALYEKIIDAQHHSFLIKEAKAIFYKERSYSTLRKKIGCKKSAYDDDMISNFFIWLESNRKDQKREDTLNLLQLIDDLLQRDVHPKKVKYHFEDTLIWRRALTRAN